MEKKSGEKIWGKKSFINDAFAIAQIFQKLSQEDEQAYHLLYQAGLYNQAFFCYIQSMEKYIKAHICEKINLSNPYFADKLRKTGHSINECIDFFVEIIAGGDSIIQSQLQNQIQQQIFMNSKFALLYNAVRYPYYRERTKTYEFRSISQKDCEDLYNMFHAFKKFVQDSSKLTSCH